MDLIRYVQKYLVRIGWLWRLWEITDLRAGYICIVVVDNMVEGVGLPDSWLCL